MKKIKVNKQGKKVDYQRVLMFKKYRDEKKTIREIAKLTNSSTATIQKYLKLIVSTTMEVKENVT